MSEPLTREEARLALHLLDRVWRGKSVDVPDDYDPETVVSAYLDTLRRELTEERERGARMAGVAVWLAYFAANALPPCELDDVLLWVNRDGVDWVPDELMREAVKRAPQSELAKADRAALDTESEVGR